MPCDPVDPVDDFKPLTADEATALRSRLPLLSVWKVVGVQAAAAVVTAVLAWALTGLVPVVQSVAKMET